MEYGCSLKLTSSTAGQMMGLYGPVGSIFDTTALHSLWEAPKINDGFSFFVSLEINIDNNILRGFFPTKCLI